MDGLLVRDGQEAVEQRLQKAPSQRRCDTAGQSSHYRINRARGSGGMAGSRALIKTIGLRRLDEQEPWPAFLMVLPKIAADARRETTDAALNEYVRE